MMKQIWNWLFGPLCRRCNCRGAKRRLMRVIESDHLKAENDRLRAAIGELEEMVGELELRLQQAQGENVRLREELENSELSCSITEQRLSDVVFKLNWAIDNLGTSGGLVS